MYGIMMLDTMASRYGMLPTEVLAKATTVDIHILEKAMAYQNRANDPNYQMVFVSRETKHWQKWTIDQLSTYGLDFKIDPYLYQVCDNATDASCWQRIIYIGDHELLKKWNRKDV